MHDGHQESRVQMRKSYTKEYKLEVVCFYHQNNSRLSSKCFLLNTKTIGWWVTDKEKIKRNKKAPKCVKHGQKCHFPRRTLLWVQEIMYVSRATRWRASVLEFKESRFFSKWTHMRVLRIMVQWIQVSTPNQPKTMCARNQQQREAVQQFHRAIGQLLMKRGQCNLLDISHCDKLLMSTRPLCHSLLPVMHKDICRYRWQNSMGVWWRFWVGQVTMHCPDHYLCRWWTKVLIFRGMGKHLLWGKR